MVILFIFSHSSPDLYFRMECLLALADGRICFLLPRLEKSIGWIQAITITWNRSWLYCIENDQNVFVTVILKFMYIGKTGPIFMTRMFVFEFANHLLNRLIIWAI